MMSLEKFNIFNFEQWGDEGDGRHIAWFASRVSWGLCGLKWHHVSLRLDIDFVCNLVPFTASSLNTPLKASGAQVVNRHVWRQKICVVLGCKFRAILLSYKQYLKINSKFTEQLNIIFYIYMFFFIQSGAAFWTSYSLRPLCWLKMSSESYNSLTRENKRNTTLKFYF